MSTDPNPPTSLTLLSLLEHNEPDAWRRIVRLYGPLVFTWVRQAGVQSPDVGRVTQEVFFLVQQRLHTFIRADKAAGGFRSWLWGITRPKILETLREMKSEEQALGGLVAGRRIEELEAACRELEPANGRTSREKLITIALCVAKSEYDWSTWEAFRRMSCRAETVRTIGEELGISERAVRQAKFRVTRTLRLLLADEFPEPDST